eukprot:4733352-Pleurochrysis_carterae.AAC.2
MRQDRGHRRRFHQFGGSSTTTPLPRCDQLPQLRSLGSIRDGTCVYARLPKSMLHYPLGPVHSVPQSHSSRDLTKTRSSARLRPGCYR